MKKKNNLSNNIWTPEEALGVLKDHEYWAEFSWLDDMAEVLIPIVEESLSKKQQLCDSFEKIEEGK